MVGTLLLGLITIITVARETLIHKNGTLLITIGKITVIIAKIRVQYLESVVLLVITIGLMMITIITAKIDRHMQDNILTTDLGQDLPRIPEFTQVNDIMEIGKVNLNRILVVTNPCQGPRMTYHAQIHLTRSLETIDLVVKIADHLADVSLLMAGYIMIQKTR